MVTFDDIPYCVFDTSIIALFCLDVGNTLVPLVYLLACDGL